MALPVRCVTGVTMVTLRCILYVACLTKLTGGFCLYSVSQNGKFLKNALRLEDNANNANIQRA